MEIAYANIFMRPPGADRSLKDFAQEMFDWFGISKFSEESIGRDDIPIYVGAAVGITVSIAANYCKSYREPYKTDLDTYPFVISFSPQRTSQAADYLAQHAHVLAWRLSQQGFRCFVPRELVGFRSERDGTVYDAR